MIQTRDLRFQYPQGPHLAFADIDIAQGSVLLLHGPSGCGKSTLLSLVAGLVAPSSGQLTVAGQSLHALKKIASDAWRSKVIGFLPQKLHLSSALTVYQNLLMAQWAAGQYEDGKRIKAVLAALGVEALAERKPSQLSGGQAQRVALARAVLQHPQVILADEPTASLDDEAARDAVRLLLDAAERQKSTLVVATHDARVTEMIPALTEGKKDVQVMQLKREQR